MKNKSDKTVKVNRRFHAYCVGTPRSGTKSIAGLFQPFYKSHHEPEPYRMTQLVISNNMDESQLANYFKLRDERLNLEMESSTLITNFLEIFVDVFKKAKFIFSKRTCASWLESYLNHHLCSIQREVPKINLKYVDAWEIYRKYTFKPTQFSYSQNDSFLKDYNLYPLDCYLSYWVRLNNKIIKTIPQDRLLIIKTEQLQNDIEKIADFLNIGYINLNYSYAHLNKIEKNFNLLSQIDPDYIKEKEKFYNNNLLISKAIFK